jgi:3-deoxy-D-manno-octulosonic-acid transferase
MVWVLNAVYCAVLVALSPWLVWRSLRTGRYRQGLRAKLWGDVPSLPPGEPVIWFHGVSVGEIHLLTTIIAAFRKRHPTHRIVVSSTTDTGLQEARVRFPNDTVIPFPFDFSWAVRRVIRCLQPKLIVLAESELWPNFLAVAKGERVPVVVVNGRMSPRSFARQMRFRRLVRRLLLRYVRLFAMQSAEYAERLQKLGVPADRVLVTGSVKYDGATAERDSTKAHELRRLLNLQGDEAILVVGSTHAPEESLLIEVFRQLREGFPALRMILVPRHPDRFMEVATLLEHSGFDWKRRSRITEPLPTMPAILLLDTIGELGAAWGLATIGFTGGSLDGQRGGQSMIEPAGYGVPVAFGPHVWNFRDAATSLVAVGGAKMVQSEAELVPLYSQWLADEAARNAAGQAAQAFVQAQQGATQKTLDALDEVMAALSEPEALAPGQSTTQK